MATQASILAWRIARTVDSGGIQSMGLQKCRTQLSDSTILFKILINRKYSTSVLMLFFLKE